MDFRYKTTLGTTYDSPVWYSLLSPVILYVQGTGWWVSSPASLRSNSNADSPLYSPIFFDLLALSTTNEFL